MSEQSIDCAVCHNTQSAEVITHRDAWTISANRAPHHLAQTPICEDCANNLSQCAECGVDMQCDAAEAAFSDTGELVEYCPACAGNHVQCESCSESTHTNFGDRDTPLCVRCAVDYLTCDSCDSVTYVGNIHSAYGGTYCETCFYETFATCESCGEYVNRDDAHIYHGDCFCRECAPDSAYETECGANVFGAACRATGNSARTFGVELEFSESDYHECARLCDMTGWGACEDGSVAQEIKSPILAGDKGIESVNRVCAEIRRIGAFDVDQSCGYHLHMGMSGEDELSLCRIAAAYQVFLPVWQLFVNVSRRNNTFCSSDYRNGTAKEIADGYIKPHKENTYNRYCAVNWCAYRFHGTLEIRLHSGTTSAEKIVNWITAHLAFVEFAKRTSFADLLELEALSINARWAHLAEHVFAPVGVAEFYRARAKEFGTELSRVSDHRETTC